MSLENRIVLLAQKIAADMSLASNIKSVQVTIPEAKSYSIISIIDEDIKADSKVIATIASREDTYDNCGDDMDNILVSTRCIPGEIILKIQSADPKQKLFGTFLINYKNN